MEGDATIRRLVEQIEQIQRQNTEALEAMHAQHQADLEALHAENEHIHSQFHQQPPSQPPQQNNDHEEEHQSPSSPPMSHRSHAPTHRSGHEVSHANMQAFPHQLGVKRHPFIDGIMETPLPLGWKPLNIDRYDNSSDLDEHINAYITQMNQYTNDNALMCRVFPTSLKGPTLTWYTQLSTGSIENFETLVRRFTTQYATSQPHHVTSAALANLRQGEDEPLRKFMERFANVSIQIHNLNPEVALHSMLMALKPGPFIDSLCRRPPPDMDELRAHAAGYIQMEEHAEFREAIRGKMQGKQDQGHKDKLRNLSSNQFKRPRHDRGGKYDFYTPLNSPRVYILEEASNTELITLPPPGHSSNNVDRTKHCRYHWNYGHTTEECRSFRDRIEELVQGGHLSQYVQTSQSHRGSY
ncbi:uncharacterized protein LOC109789618 [Cajanus cajan]|uniref:uncharacterized protein LOC109789618 n=1 Tax=Cajanus cajan TaxID=3821 RepID=UPI00098DAF29|nr:uncharacterized protein LOC109789618 [Cajanus cajan]